MVKVHTSFAIAATIIAAVVTFLNFDEMTLLSWLSSMGMGIILTYWIARIEG